MKEVKEPIEESCTESVKIVNEENSLSSDDHLINSYIDTNKETIFTPKKPVVSSSSPSSTQARREFNDEYDYYLNNFEAAIKSVLNERAYSCLLNDFDIQTINTFSQLPSKRTLLCSML